MKINNLGSSSAGNAYLLDMDGPDGSRHVILLEAGFAGMTLHRKIIDAGYSLENIEAVLITHSHKDHAAAAGELHRHGKRVYGNSMVCSGPDTLIEADHVKAIAPDVFVYPFLVEHDAPNTYGYLITCDTESLLFMTDLAYTRTSLSSFAPTYLMIEANYDGQTMHFALQGAREAGDAARAAEYERIIKTHMSLKNAIKTAKTIDLSKCQAVFLIHLSDRHSRALDFKWKAHQELGKPVYICQKNGGII